MTNEEKEVILHRTQRECDAIKQRDCYKCAYSSTDNRKYLRQGTCDYVIIVGRSRPCLAGECRRAGVWKEKTRNKEAKAFKINL